MYYSDAGVNAYIYYCDTHFIDEEAKEEEMTYPMFHAVQPESAKARM